MNNLCFKPLSCIFAWVTATYLRPSQQGNCKLTTNNQTLLQKFFAKCFVNSNIILYFFQIIIAFVVSPYSVFVWLAIHLFKLFIYDCNKCKTLTENLIQSVVSVYYCDEHGIGCFVCLLFIGTKYLILHPQCSEGVFDKLPCVHPEVLNWVSPWQELIERSLTLSWWRHVPRARLKWSIPQAEHLGLTQVSPWNYVKAIRT